MGASTSRNSESGHGGGEGLDQVGGQLYVSLKMENYKLNGELMPHVYGSVPLVGSWDSSKALPMERESTSIWELSFVVPPNHETLDFKFLLKPKYQATPCIVEEGPNRLLTRGALQGDRRLALFRISNDEVLEYRVLIKADRVSPFDLAASWRAYLENLQPSTVRGIPDVSINSAPDTSIENGSAVTLELDLEHYVIPAPAGAASTMTYAANLAETPRSLGPCRNSSSADTTTTYSNGTNENSQSLYLKDMEATIADNPIVAAAPGMVDKSVGAVSPLRKQDGQRGFLVDRGVGSPRHARSSSATIIMSRDLKLDSEVKTMPAAAGAVAAAAIADQMLGPKEDRKLAIVLVGLPARGKTFTAAKLTRYLRWLGHETKHFNVGKSADFFRGDNPEGIEARNEVAALAMEDMLLWMQEGGQVGIFDATNSTRERRNMLMKMAEGKSKVRL
ncbi:6-phosphofructo-2-kinase/fructose-2-6-bisphosphatase [Nymphaea thermarum]|nr:6-phosphofructo-2-kinase/fructose-2-6-bisphosphatase [Nymphaea thermarum]